MPASWFHDTDILIIQSPSEIPCGFALRIERSRHLDAAELLNDAACQSLSLDGPTGKKRIET